MSDSVPPPPVPPEVAAAQEPWPVTPEADGPAVEQADDTHHLEADEFQEMPTGALLTRVASDQLGRLATPVQLGLVILGTLGAFNAIGTDAQGSRRAFGFLVTVGLLIVAGVLLKSMLEALSALLLAQADQADATGRIEQHLASGLERLNATLEALAASAGPAAPAALELKAQHLAEIRHAVRACRWPDADDLVKRFAEARPDDPDAPRIAEEVAEARRTAAQERLARVEAAREVNDPERVVELRDELRQLLPVDALRALDRDLARWFLLLISRRLRAGTVRADVAALAARVAESLNDTPEGASLRASLPTLRRAAGLCARCGQPYVGVADACPACLSIPRPAPGPPPAPPIDGNGPLDQN